jgi:hypothetical protein
MEKIRAFLSNDCFIKIFYFFSSFRMSAVRAFLGFTNRGLLGNPLEIERVLIAQQLAGMRLAQEYFRLVALRQPEVVALSAFQRL